MMRPTSGTDNQMMEAKIWRTHVRECSWIFTMANNE